MKAQDNDTAYRRIIRLVILLNLSYFGIEFVVASRIGSVSLFADSVDFLEDASLNLLILAALRLSNGDYSPITLRTTLLFRRPSNSA